MLADKSTRFEKVSDAMQMVLYPYTRTRKKDYTKNEKQKEQK